MVVRFRSALLLGACAVAFVPAASGAKSPQAKKYPADAAVAWMDLLYERVKADGVAPPPAARIYGIGAITMYLAIEPGMKKTHQSLQGQLQGLAEGSVPAPPKKKALHWPTVLNTAVHDVLVDLFSTSANSVTAFDALEDQLNSGFQASIKQKQFDRSVEQGASVATAVLAWLATDTGFADQVNCPAYTPGSDPEDWQPTPPPAGTGNPAFPCWGQVRTFVLQQPDEVTIPDFPTFGTSPTADLFYAQGLEVLASKPAAATEEEHIALFWADNPTATGTPPGHWIDTVRQIAVAEDLNLPEAVTAFTRVGIGVHDAFVACWHYKYVYNLLRPHTYIFNHIDNTWTPLLTTPMFPEYPSGHSTQSGAAVAMLEDAFGFVFEYTDTMHTDQNGGAIADRSFESFDQAGREAALSRLYGGIHYRAANENGYECGHGIGLLIRNSVELEKGEDGPALP